MGELEKRIEYELNQAAFQSDKVWKAATGEGGTATPAELIDELIAPTLGAMRKAILELAREVDEIRDSD